MPWREPEGLSGPQVRQIDLKERVVRLALALEDQTLAISAEVTLAGSLALKGELPDVGEKSTARVRLPRPIRFDLRLLV